MDDNLSPVNAGPEVNVEPQIDQSGTTESAKGEAAPSAAVKPVQTPEENAHFAEQRRAREAAEAKAAKLEKDYSIAKTYGADYGIFSEEDISAKYGHMGIKTVEQFKAQLEKQEKEEALRAKGIDPNALEHELNEHPDVKEARELKQRNKVYAEFEEWHKENKDSLPDVDKLPQPVIDAFFKGESMIIAFMRHEYAAQKEARQKEVEAAKTQAANEKNAADSTGSVKPSAPAGGALTDEMVAEMSPQELAKRWGEVRKLYNMQ